MKKYIFIALLVFSLGIATPTQAQVITQSQIQAMSQEEKKALIIKLMTLLIDLMRQLQTLQLNQNHMTTDIKVTTTGSATSNLDQKPDFKINRFVVRGNGNVLIESLVELNLQDTQFIVNNEVLPVKIDDVLGVKTGNYFVYETAVTPNLYTVSKQKEGESGNGSAFALFTVKIVSKDGQSMVSKEALQAKSNAYEVAVDF